MERTGARWAMLGRREFLGLGAVLAVQPFNGSPSKGAGPVLRADSFEHHAAFFNSMVDEGVVQHIPDADAWKWMSRNIPLFECPDADFERTWYYRWWSYRKHIKQTSDGFIVTEFLRPVRHATTHNAISCALGHHLDEGRWLLDDGFLDEYLLFWLRSGPGGGLQPKFHQYSGWASHAVWSRWLVNRDTRFVASIFDSLVLDFRTWEQERLLESGLFWQFDVRDGMEESISGSRTAKNARPTINSYMYGNARALALLAAATGRRNLEREYGARAERIRSLVEDRLWDAKAGFFKPLQEAGSLADVREEIGFIPWVFGLPEPGRGFERAWRELADPAGFRAPFGLTSAEQRHPGFKIAFEGDDCQWNGPIWPFATVQTLKGLANVLRGYRQDVVSRRDYFDALKTYTMSQRLRLEDGRVIPWIDEDLHPFTGEWLARLIKIRKGRFEGRGDHYNHSTYCDLIITGLAGLVPRADDRVEVHPLLPEGAWDWFCLDRVKYHGRLLTILWDKEGTRYGRGKGLLVFCDGREIARASSLGPVRAKLRGVDRA
jgi:hypothetical protein